ncbi:type IV secretion system protein VirB10 [Novosphingobium hassiacum]|uniref:Type IV secretion system protein VirB10 n=1 Tax=Novosphingobium hassiacum TaxID=173676 RepID=A0A7W6EXU8_9SPHN|nr:TrbI/VirB10 family protein [Novosphingobium hassiacum]MBB3862460.1 type IV secretion system protein VirB10 [Novosphingobium hassiacum]
MIGPERDEGQAQAAREANLAQPAGVAPEHRAAVAANPGAFRLAGPHPRVTRLSRKALATIGMVAAIGIGGSLLYALRPVHHGPAVNLVDTDSRNKAAVVTAAPASYDKVPKLGAPMPGDLGRPILSAQQNGQSVPVLPIGPSTVQPDSRLAAAEQARQRAMQERESARASKLFLGAEGARSASPVSGIQSAKAGRAVTASDAAGAAPAGQPAGQSAKKAFLQNGGNRVAASNERIMAPVSAYLVQAGSVIPAALITGIRSDLPGQITAQVTQNVYDSATGRILLIPQGARLIGEYDSEVSAGQNRVLLAWDRLILPGGRSILLERQPGADASGMSGVQDKVNYHWGNMLRAAMVSTMLGAGTQLAAQGDDELTRALRYGMQDTVSQTGRQVVQREINVPPTLTVRSGFAIRVVITRDLVLEPAAEAQP